MEYNIFFYWTASSWKHLLKFFNIHKNVELLEMRPYNYAFGCDAPNYKLNVWCKGKIERIPGLESLVIEKA